MSTSFEPGAPTPAGFIPPRPLWEVGHLSPAHGWMRATDCAVTERLNRDAISLPRSVGMSGESMARVIEAVKGNYAGRN